jgi:hypothetical protein
MSQQIAEILLRTRLKSDIRRPRRNPSAFHQPSGCDLEISGRDERGPFCMVQCNHSRPECRTVSSTPQWPSAIQSKSMSNRDRMRFGSSGRAIQVPNVAISQLPAWAHQHSRGSSKINVGWSFSRGLHFNDLSRHFCSHCITRMCVPSTAVELRAPNGDHAHDIRNRAATLPLVGRPW